MAKSPATVWVLSRQADPRPLYSLALFVAEILADRKSSTICFGFRGTSEGAANEEVPDFLHGDVQNPNGHDPGQPALVDPA